MSFEGVPYPPPHPSKIIVPTISNLNFKWVKMRLILYDSLLLWGKFKIPGELQKQTDLTGMEQVVKVWKRILEGSSKNSYS